MKKFFAVLIAGLLVLSLAACGNSGGDTGETTADAIETEAVTEAPETEQPDDTALAEAEKEKLIGSWSFPGLEGVETLTFNEDGTGTYDNMDGNHIQFNYLVTVDHQTYNNGEAYINYMLNMDYDTGESEDIIFFYTDENHLAFHNSENGGYSGVMNFAEWEKQ